MSEPGECGSGIPESGLDMGLMRSEPEPGPESQMENVSATLDEGGAWHSCPAVCRTNILKDRDLDTACRVARGHNVFCERDKDSKRRPLGRGDAFGLL